MMFRPIALLLSAFMFLSCGIQTNVGHFGQYTSLPESEVADTNLYPMKHLLLVEEDALSGKTFIYLFSGNLSEAGVGIEDLQRVALRFGRYNIAFRYPRSFFLEQTIESTGERLELIAADSAVGELQPLEEDDHLYLSGAFPILRNLNMDVQAWFGTYQNNEVDGPVTLTLGEETLEIQSPLNLPTFTITPEEDRININTGALNALDYRVMDLFQTGSSIEDGTPREFTVATSLGPNDEYFASHLLLQDAFGKSCWSIEKSLKLRITQVARRYVEDSTNPWGIIYRRINTRNLAPDDWQSVIDTSTIEMADYCESYN